MREEVEEALSNLSIKATWLMPPRAVKPLKVEEAFEGALRQALAAPSLLEERKVGKAVVVIPDHTRPSSPFLSKLLEVVEGLAGEVSVVIAGGTHPPPPFSKLKQALGPLVEDGWFKLRHSYAYSRPSNFRRLGYTSRGTPVEVYLELVEADLVVSTLCVRPHYFAGWEGGCKAILPGCSSIDSVRHNHSLAVGCLDARELKVDGNPVRMDMEEAGRAFAGKVRYRALDWTMDAYGGLAAAYYGDPVQVHRAVAKEALKYYAIMSPPARLAVAIAEPPLGCTLFQALKAYHLACNLAPREGVLKVVLAAPLNEGVGSEAFAKELVRYAGRPLGEVVGELKARMSEGEFSEVFPKLARMAMDSQRAELAVVSPSAASDVKDLLAKVGIPFYEGLDEALRGFEEAVVLPYGASTVPISSGSSTTAFIMST